MIRERVYVCSFFDYCFDFDFIRFFDFVFVFYYDCSFFVFCFDFFFVFFFILDDYDFADFHWITKCLLWVFRYLVLERVLSNIVVRLYASNHKENCL